MCIRDSSFLLGSRPDPVAREILDFVPRVAGMAAASNQTASPSSGRHGATLSPASNGASSTS
eukprot:5745807-Prorocentrum_lima.AAC.1